MVKRGIGVEFDAGMERVNVENEEMDSGWTKMMKKRIY